MVSVRALFLSWVQLRALARQERCDRVEDSPFYAVNRLFANEGVGGV